jgi:hypothetical protein
MLINCPPTPNTERQRWFRKRNPGYYRRYRRRRKQQLALFELARKAALANGVPEPAAQKVAHRVSLEQIRFIEAQAKARRLLMLPLPVKSPVITDINALREKLASNEAELVPVTTDASHV